MITALVQFKLPQSLTRDKAQDLFQGTAPRYRDTAGLIRKYYLLSEDGRTVGGVYLWRSKDDAKVLFTEAWTDFIMDRYGAERPSVTYFESPVVVDNVAGQIVSD
jgi:hypothetical protein